MKSPDGVRVKLRCLRCGAEFEVQPHRVKRAKYCGFSCKQSAATTARNIKSRYTGSTENYIKVNKRHMHRVVAEQMLGRKLIPGEIVHHKNRNKWDNSPENLEVTNQSNHVREHIREMLERRKVVAGY